MCVCGGGVGCFGLNGPSDNIKVYIRQSCSLPERGRKKREMIDESKNVQTIRTYCKCCRPLPCYNQISRTPRHWKFTQHHHTSRPPGGMEGRKAEFAGKTVDTDRITKNPNIQIQIFLFFLCLWERGRRGRARECVDKRVGAIIFTCDALCQPNIGCFNFHRDIP